MLDLASKMYSIHSPWEYLYPFLVSVLPSLIYDLSIPSVTLYVGPTHDFFSRIYSKKACILLVFSNFNEAKVFNRLLCRNVNIDLRAGKAKHLLTLLYNASIRLVFYLHVYFPHMFTPTYSTLFGILIKALPCRVLSSISLL